MKSSTKTNLKNAFLSLIRNESAIESAKTTPAYVPIIASVIAAFIPVVPLMVSVSRTYGSQFLKAQTYNLDRYNVDAMLSLKEQGIEFKVNGQNQLLMYKDGSDAPYDMSREDETTPVAEYVTNKEGYIQIQYQVFYSTRVNKGAATDKILTLTKEITNTTYLTGTEYVKDSDEAAAYIEAKQAEIEGYTPTYYRPTFVVLYKDGIYTYLTNAQTFKKITSVAGDWKHYLDKDVGLVERLVSVDGYDASTLLEKDTNGDYKLLRDKDYVGSVQLEMNKVYNEAYITSKNNSFLMYTFVFFGVYLVLIVFMGLMIFILTRGKKNPMNYMTFWLSLKIAMWASISPAILALILGFILTNFATMFFILLYGVRVMWLSMRQLRPTY